MSKNKIVDPTKRNDAHEIKKIKVYEDEIVYDRGGTLGIYHRAPTLEEIKEMNDGELIRAMRTGASSATVDFGYHRDTVFTVQCVDAVKHKSDTCYGNVSLVWSKNVRSLQDALKHVDFFNMMWDGSRCVLKDVSGIQWNGNDNEDIATYLVISDGRLMFVISCQYIGDRESLEKDAVKRFDENDEFYTVEQFNEFVKNAEKFAKNSGGKVKFKRVKPNDWRDNGLIAEPDDVEDGVDLYKDNDED